MTPKEKAKELIDKFRFGKPVQYLGREADEIDFSKECALIAVDYVFGIINFFLEQEGADFGSTEYWQQVKQEIEKL